MCFVGTVGFSVAAVLVSSVVVVKEAASISHSFSAFHGGCAVLTCGWKLTGGWGSGSGRKWGVAVFVGGLRQKGKNRRGRSGTFLWFQGPWTVCVQRQGKGKR